MCVKKKTAYESRPSHVGSEMGKRDRYQESARTRGFEGQGEFTGGAADSGLTASVGVPTLCATGPVGGHPHTEREYCELTTFVPRAQAVALAVLGHP